MGKNHACLSLIQIGPRRYLKANFNYWYSCDTERGFDLFSPQCFTLGPMSREHGKKKDKFLKEEFSYDQRHLKAK